MLLVGMMFAAFVIGGLLMDYSATMLVQVIQGCAVLTIILNVIALWKQEARNTAVTAPDRETPVFSDLWQSFVRDGRNARLLTAIGIGAAGFAMQDALLEPYGGEILGLSVGATTGLTGAWALGSLIGFMLSGRWLARGWDPLRLAGGGLVIGVNALLVDAFVLPVCVFSGSFCVRLFSASAAHAASADGGDGDGEGEDARTLAAVCACCDSGCVCHAFAACCATLSPCWCRR